MKMKRNVVGALLSGLVFPGVGQWWLGRRARGLVFLVVAAGAAYVYVDAAFDQASALAGQLLGGQLLGGVPADPAALAARLEAQPTPPAQTVGGLVFLGAWIGSVADALFVRRA